MGFKMEIPYATMNLKNPSKLQKVVMDRFLKERETVAEGCVDECLKYILGRFRVNLSEEILYPFHDELSESFFDVMVFATQQSINDYLSATIPKILFELFKKKRPLTAKVAE